MYELEDVATVRNVVFCGFGKGNGTEDSKREVGK